MKTANGDFFFYFFNSCACLSQCDNKIMKKDDETTRIKIMPFNYRKLNYFIYHGMMNCLKENYNFHD